MNLNKIHRILNYINSAGVSEWKKREKMTDLQSIKFMLDRANIQYAEDIRTDYQYNPYSNPPSPKYSKLICLKVHSDFDQPEPGGYSFFESEFVFLENGDLLAVWAWE